MGVQLVIRATSAKDRLTLDQRLRLHKFIQPITDRLQREKYGVSLFTAALALLILAAARHSTSLWFLLGFAVWFIFTVVTTILWLIWWRNVMMLALYDDIAVLAPLLDFADATFLRHRHKPGKQPRTSEATVLPHLPALLARMPAGDGPVLTPSQKTTLRRLVCDRRYEEHFYAPGLREKADWMVYR